MHSHSSHNPQHPHKKPRPAALHLSQSIGEVETKGSMLAGQSPVRDTSAKDMVEMGNMMLLQLKVFTVQTDSLSLIPGGER